MAVRRSSRSTGYGRHGVFHEQRFFELPEVLPVMVEFIVSPEEADKMLALVRAEKIHTFLYPYAYGSHPHRGPMKDGRVGSGTPRSLDGHVFELT